MIVEMPLRAVSGSSQRFPTSTPRLFEPPSSATAFDVEQVIIDPAPGGG